MLPLGDGRVWMLTESVFAESPRLRLAQQTSHPESLLSHWISLFGEETMMRLAHHSLVHPPIIVHGIGDAPLDHSLDRALAHHDEPGFFILDGDRSNVAAWLRDHPDVIVQDPTSAAAIEATRHLQPSPRLIIDACAGMGTKTRQLAALHPYADIIATDVADARLLALQRQFAESRQVKIVDHSHLNEWIGQADLVLLDVPCSNTGVLARRVEARYRFSRETLKSVVDLQRQIIADSLTLLRESGHILYSTCSIDPDENEHQAEWLCQWHPFETIRQHTRLPTGVPGDPPGVHSDGGYHALLRRTRSI
jgi:16S rRNA (cytosine967-C5)-methyltransferase